MRQTMRRPRFMWTVAPLCPVESEKQATATLKSCEYWCHQKRPPSRSRSSLGFKSELSLVRTCTRGQCLNFARTTYYPCSICSFSQSSREHRPAPGICTGAHELPTYFPSQPPQGGLAPKPSPCRACVTSVLGLSAHTLCVPPLGDATATHEPRHPQPFVIVRPGTRCFGSVSTNVQPHLTYDPSMRLSTRSDAPRIARAMAYGLFFTWSCAGIRFLIHHSSLSRLRMPLKTATAAFTALPRARISLLSPTLRSGEIPSVRTSASLMLIIHTVVLDIKSGCAWMPYQHFSPLGSDLRVLLRFGHVCRDCGHIQQPLHGQLLQCGRLSALHLRRLHHL
ncbi:hypothetical protein K466DRAFT_150647 [Polyporus arcularius HHB13444]|uniref:Uncharacterized protein n=1 Tax=Polyporus arcularius HHB13444 TaxID=1314778 RepID=A0A5C3PCZ6_9APHY|nr:hypothetical protein K466DRAFT_150647 [Polyporus arcularius HHB13444]